MFRQLIAVLVVALCVGAGVTTAQTQSPAAATDTFIWHGELVAVDQATGTFTIKARMLADVAKEVGRFNAGDRIVLTWSGIEKYGDAIRAIAKSDANQKVVDLFTMPVELASRDVQNDYVTIKFRAPGTVTAVKAVKPGEWVTVTARQRGSGDAQSIVAVEPYNKPSSGT